MPRKKSTIFVIQKHNASRLHYDFRLEADGVLKSWAVPKGPSSDPSMKRLAVEVPDHAYSYRDFEGTLPEGSYGAGEVIVWDNGTYELIGKEDFAECFEKGSIDFALKGKKLKGQFSLVRMKWPKQWLLIKKNDEYASVNDVLTDNSSVISKRVL